MREAFDAAAPASQGHFVTMLSRVAFIEATLGQNVGSKSDNIFPWQISSIDWSLWSLYAFVL